MATKPIEGLVWSDAALQALPKDGRKRELLDGAIQMSPTGFEHERIVSELMIRLGSYVRAEKLGLVLGSDLGFRLGSDDVLCPDVSFVRADRMRNVNCRAKGFFEGAPDLVVEVLSPTDSFGAVERKLAKYFGAETRLAWVIHPSEEKAFVYRAGAKEREIGRCEALDGEELIPGFSVPLGELLDPPTF